MTKHWKRSRITKALTDAARAGSFKEAEARLDAVRVAVILGPDQAATAAGQAAALTAVATARKCFGRVTLVSEAYMPLIATLPLGATLHAAARRLGGRASRTEPARTTHAIVIGEASCDAPWSIRCWWDRWLAGTRASEKTLGDSRLALAGVFAAALAMRQIFACVLAAKSMRPRDAIVSLWTPWETATRENRGAECYDVPDHLWFLGLGHLGQGFIWNLCLLGAKGGHAVVQDDQAIGEENEATSLLVLPGESGAKKARIAAGWLEVAGWSADILERRHHGDIRLLPGDPPYLLSGLDRVEPRLVMARHGFDYMIDAGLGHGPHDFEGIQLRVIAKGVSADDLWSTPDDAVDAKLAERKSSAAYKDLEARIGQCGIVSFAEASTSVPFVGAAAGALVIAQAIRLASMNPTARFLQMQMSAPEMVSVAGFTEEPTSNMGSVSTAL
jgi:hypothetical protein